MPWKKLQIENSNYSRVVFFLLLITLLSVAFQIRFLNTIVVILLGVVPVVHPNRINFLKQAFHNTFFLALLGLFLLKVAGLFYTHHLGENWNHVTGRIVLITIPLFFLSLPLISTRLMQRLMLFFSLSLLLVCFVCLAQATLQYNKQHLIDVFFYHKLVAPFKHHAIFFSFYLFFCIIYWFEEGLYSIEYRFHRILLIGMLIFFYVFIFLLSSKLAIALSFLYLIYYLIKNVFSTHIRHLIPTSVILITALLAAIVFTNNPVKKRFEDVTSGNVTLFQQERFSPGVYFNGLQFRLLTWRFTYEILNRQNAWLLGVSPGDAQYQLNKRYSETHVYMGDGVNDSKGYSAFNCHNVFLQTTLESGLLGLALIILMIVSLFAQAIKQKRASTIIFFSAIIALCFTDSLLSGQYAMLLFILFPLLSLKAQAIKNTTDKSF